MVGETSLCFIKHYSEISRSQWKNPPSFLRGGGGETISSFSYSGGEGWRLFPSFFLMPSFSSTQPLLMSLLCSHPSPIIHARCLLWSQRLRLFE